MKEERNTIAATSFGFFLWRAALANFGVCVIKRKVDDELDSILTQN